jgi:hypothetical protein
LPERRSLEGNNLRYYIFLFNRILLFNIFQVSWRPRYNYWYCPDIELLFNVRVISIDITRTLKYYSMCGWYQLILPGVWKFSQRYVRIIFSYWTIISMEHVLNKNIHIFYYNSSQSLLLQKGEQQLKRNTNRI